MNAAGEAHRAFKSASAHLCACFASCQPYSDGLQYAHTSYYAQREVNGFSSAREKFCAATSIFYRCTEERVFMPTYHYRCKNCGYDFTQEQSFEDSALTVCPNCHEEQLRKVFSAVPIEFKGKGFYRTDHSSK